jgi:Putative beta-barrel porin 2
MTPPGDRRSAATAIVFLAFVSALILMMTTDAKAVNMDVVPSIRLEEGWDSNAFNSSTNEVSSFGTRLTPGLALRFTSPENVMVGISGEYEIVRYHASEAKEADNEAWFFRIDSNGAWKLTPNLSMTPSVYYLNTTDSFSRSQRVPSGDPVLPPVTINNYVDTKTEEFGGAVRLNYLATENLTLGVTGNYSEQQFSDSTEDSGVTDSTTTGGNASVSYRFSPKTSLGIIVAGNQYMYENNPDSETLSGGILFEYQFSPVFRINGAFGWSYIRQDEGQGVPEQRESAPSGLFNASYTSETFTASVFGSAVYSGGSGYGEATRQWTAGFALNDQFAREWSWSLRGTYQASSSAFETDAVDITTIYGSAGLRYKPWEWGSLDLTGFAERQTTDGQFGNDLNNYVATLGITIGKPYRVF